MTKLAPLNASVPDTWLALYEVGGSVALTSIPAAFVGSGTLFSWTGSGESIAAG